MKRSDIITTIGRKFLDSNIENDEFSYQKAFTAAHKDFASVKIGSFKDLDIRFVDKQARVAVLVETKQNFDNAYEKAQKAHETQESHDTH